MITGKEIYVDIDNTICYILPGDLDYNNALPDKRRIAIVNRLYDNGNKITMWTARGSVTGVDWHDITLDQLDRWGVKFHTLLMRKPFYDLLIDDKAITCLEQIELIDKLS